MQHRIHGHVHKAIEKKQESFHNKLYIDLEPVEPQLKKQNILFVFYSGILDSKIG